MSPQSRRGPRREEEPICLPARPVLGRETSALPPAGTLSDKAAASFPLPPVRTITWRRGASASGPAQWAGGQDLSLRRGERNRNLKAAAAAVGAATSGVDAAAAAALAPRRSRPPSAAAPGPVPAWGAPSPGDARRPRAPTAMTSPPPDDGASSSDCIIVLDDDNDGDRGPAPATPPPPDGPLRPPSPPPTAPPLDGSPPGGQKGLRAENERLFQEFVAFCSEHTKDTPEVITYLSGRHQKTNPEYLASVEFHNVLSRCLTRVQARRNKIYVYINELCTSFRAHSQRKKAVAPVPAEAQDAPAAPAPQTPAKPCVDAKRQIRYLENLLRVYAREIQRLQEQELDLAALDSQDSAYLQESRLKRRLMHVFKRLCQLKDCSSLTGRVIEQRIPYRGTRYPEVNRRIERLINQPESFPDFADILKVVQKASARHSLGLPKRQMEAMAADAFRDVGARLQERRHLDLVYNFGSHLTDQYRPNTDPATGDAELSRHLHRNQLLGHQRLEEVIAQFAQLQDKSQEQPQPGGRPPRQDGGGAQPGRAAEGEPASPKESVSGTAAEEDSAGPQESGQKKGSSEEEEEEEEEEEDSDSESDLDAELAHCLDAGEVDEEEDEEQEAAAGEAPPALDTEADQQMEVPEVALSSADEEEEEEEEEEDGLLGSSGDSPAQQEEGAVREVSPAPSIQEEEEAPPAKRPHLLENGELNGQPPCKRSRTAWGQTPVSSSSSPPCRAPTCIRVPSSGSEGEDEEGPPPQSPGPAADSTRPDSPGLSLVSSTQGSPPAPPRQQQQDERLTRTSVATQCDPEEIIVLSDSE